MKLIELTGILTLLFTVTLVNAQTTTQWGPNGYVKIENGSGGFNANEKVAIDLVETTTKQVT